MKICQRRLAESLPGRPPYHAELTLLPATLAYHAEQTLLPLPAYS